jgi:NADH-quinone oxidoreductase subunit N
VTSVAGFGFKIAAAPFHLWAPDAYEAAPVPSAAFIASGSKVASFFVLAKLLTVGMAGASGSGAWLAGRPGWAMTLAALAALSMIAGNLGALVQSNVRRLLAYSAIAHAGYMLLGILGNRVQGLESLVFYVLTYGATTIGTFAIVYVVESQPADGVMDDFAGLSRRSPLLALCLLVFLLSLAGIPPLVGFFGKFYLFAAAINGPGHDLGMVWLVILAVATSAVSLYYYLQVLKQAFVVPPPENASPIRVPVGQLLPIVVTAILVVLLGCCPNSLLGAISAAVAQTVGR